ncbi:MAG: Proline/betaine transporter [Candidatus Anoxychlamydiales bacterium]|nr:Proline/betaine transporter [Candidatus Anoxychlamydiales bacterium]
MNHIEKILINTKFHLTKLGRENVISMLGMAIEYYNIFLYGYASSIIIAKFFAQSSSLIVILAMLLSYLMGPLGALFFGHIGDKKGRKKILALAIALVSIPSFLISLLPSYDQIGVLASVLFIILRSVQTMAFGGDTIGLATFVLEDAPAKHRGLFGGFMATGGTIGIIFASFVVSVFDPLKTLNSSWRWRIPLAMGIFGIIISIYFFRTFGETDTFKHYKKKYYRKTLPIVDLFKKNKLNFSRIVGITALVPIITIIVFGYIPFLGVSHLRLSSSLSMWSNTLSLVLYAIFSPMFGIISDKLGRKPILLAVSLTFLITGYPLFLLLDNGSILTFFLIQLFFSIVSSAYYGVTMATCIEHFPTHVRYTGVALGYYVTYALFGGINGLYFAKLLMKDLHVDAAPVVYLLFGALIVFISTLFLKEEALHKLHNR